MLDDLKAHLPSPRQQASFPKEKRNDLQEGFLAASANPEVLRSAKERTDATNFCFTCRTPKDRQGFIVSSLSGAQDLGS